MLIGNDNEILYKLEPWECLHFEDTTRPLMITHTIESCWIPSQTRSNDLEDIGQDQRSSRAIHILMLVIICTKYGNNSSGTADATKRTRFSRPRLNDLEDIGQGQRSLYATHPLILVIICAKHGKNPSRTVDFFFNVRPKKIQKVCQKFKFPDFKQIVTRHTPSNNSDHVYQIQTESF